MRIKMRGFTDARRERDAVQTEESKHSQSPSADSGAFAFALSRHQSGAWLEAEQLYADIIRSCPDHFDALHLSGLIACQTKRYEEAERLLSAAMKIKPDFADIHYHYGFMLKNLGRMDEALSSLDKAISLEPDHHEAWFESGNILSQLSLHEQALARFDKAIEINPDDAGAYLERGITLKDLQRFTESIDSLRTAIALHPGSAEAWLNCGLVLREIDLLQESLDCLDRAISLRPDFAPAHLSRGVTLHHLARFGEAVESYDEAIRNKADYIEAYVNRGNALVELGRLDAALSDLSHAATLNPQTGHLYHSMGHLLLLIGKLKEGFECYEWRKNQTHGIGLLPFTRPQWLGHEDLRGKRILIYDDQGIGDAIHFSRYARLLEARGAFVIFAVRDRLLKLMQSLSETIVICRFKDIPQDFDFQCPLMSLPHAFKTDLDSVPAEPAYLKPFGGKVEQWSQRIGSAGVRIGVCWQGSTGKFGVGRSFALSHFRILSDIPGVRLISLHRGEGESQLSDLPEGMVVETLGESFDSGPDAFADTAAVMTSCDLVITSDTSIAHLAGALGVKTWVVLKHVPEWRWMLNRDDSPWYPSIRLFRQPRVEDWDGAFRQVRDALVAEIASGRLHQASSSAT